jgi:RecA/RadA recombinase
MKEILIKYFRGQALNIDEAVKMINEYMEKIEVNRPELIPFLLSPTNPIGQHMLQHAVSVSAKYLATFYTITTLTNKENKVLMVF